MALEEAWAWLDAKPRLPLAHLPTRLEPLDRLSQELGGPRIWCKRDDCTGLATGGNKTRKLEYLLADARRAGASTVVTFGGVQSNHARQTAAACAKAGFDCHLVLSRVVDWRHPAYERCGNVQLDRLLGAKVHLFDADQTADGALALIQELANGEGAPYVIPTGGSNAVGALGYARAALELAVQCEEHFALTDVFHATASAGTQSGLLLGFGAAEAAVRVHGVQVYSPDRASFAATISGMVAEARGEDAPGRPLEDDDIRIEQGYLGDGYGIPTAAGLEAVGLVARLEGLLLDPVYSGKAMSGLIDQIATGALRDRSDVVFLHTGGSASLPAYDDVLGAP